MTYKNCTYNYEKRVWKLKMYMLENKVDIPLDLFKATLSAWGKIEDYGKTKPHAVKEASEKYGCTQKSINDMLGNFKIKYVAQKVYRKSMGSILKEDYHLKQMFKTQLETED